MKTSNSVLRMESANRSALCGLAAIRAIKSGLHVAVSHSSYSASRLIDAKYQSECAAHAAFLAYPHLRDTFAVGYGNIVS